MKWLVLLLGNLIAPLVALGVIVHFLFSARRGLLSSLPDQIRERGGFPREESLARIRGRPVLWVHAASSGEVLAAAPLISRIKELPSPPAVVITTVTEAGRRTATESSDADLALLAPLDALPTVSGFLHTIRPYALIIVETELWPHMIALSRSAGLTIGLVNGRISEKSFGRYRLFAWALRPFLRSIEGFAVQTDADARRFAALGAPPDRIQVTGNMKYDRTVSPDDTRARARVASLGWEGAPLLVAGSTHPGEEETIAAAFVAVKKRFPRLRLVMAPRHVERSSETAAALDAVGITTSLWSSTEENKTVECLLIDTMGVLGAFYPLASVSFVGGTLAPVGGHNLLEPALTGSPVVFGPHVDHVREIAAMLESSGGGFRVDGAAELARCLETLLSEKDADRSSGAKAKAAAESLQGATGRTVAAIRRVITPPSPADT